MVTSDDSAQWMHQIAAQARPPRPVRPFDIIWDAKAEEGTQESRIARLRARLPPDIMLIPLRLIDTDRADLRPDVRTWCEEHLRFPVILEVAHDGRRLPRLHRDMFHGRLDPFMGCMRWATIAGKPRSYYQIAVLGTRFQNKADRLAFHLRWL